MMIGLLNNIVLAGEFSNGQPQCSKENSEAETWAKTLFEPTDILEIRCFPSKKMSAGQSPFKFTWKQTFQRNRFHPWVQAGEIATLIDRLREFNSAGITTYWRHHDDYRRIKTIDDLPLNIYCSANPRARVGGTKSKDVALARSLFVDLDDISADQAAEKVRNSGLPTPTMTVNSGHGVHLYWRLLDPIADLTTWKSVQKRLIQLLCSDSVIHDPARMMRLPGFANLNGEPAPSHILDADGDRRYALDEIDAVLPLAERHRESTSTATSSLPIVDPDRESIVRRALAYANKVPRVPHGQRNSTIFKLATNLRERFGLTANELLQMTKLWNARLDEPLDYAELCEVTKKAFRFVDATNLPRGRLPPIKTFEEPEGPVVNLADWRSQMQTKRLDSLKEPPQVYFDKSTTGAGKSTADLVAMKEAGQSLTLLPTHEACEELTAKMKTEGLDAAAFPALNESTCQRFGDPNSPDDAQVAQRAGIDVGTALCTDCPFYKNCVYQQRRQQARNAPHVVATHARAAHSSFAIAQDKPLVFIHEDCRELLRPTMRIAANRTSLDPNVRHMDEILRIAEEAIDLAEVWHDRAKQDFAINLHKSIKQLIAHLRDNGVLEEVREANSAGFLDQITRVKSLGLRSRTDRPDRSDYLLYRAMRNLGLNANGEALRLCLAYACGELESLTLVIDDTFTSNGKDARQFHQSLVAVRRVVLPEQTTIWFEDATGDYDLISELIQRLVDDATPVGRLEFKVPPIQFTRDKESDVTLQTAGNTIRALIRGLLMKYPSAKAVGVITHRRHLPEIERLEPLWRSRLSKLDYFRSGNDRASNKWLECNLLLILGTPRLPPSAVREALIQTGDVAAAARDGKWRSHTWQGRTLQGDLIDVQGLGYEDPSWSRMHEILVRSNLQQAVGRGRGVIESGVQVIVVSNESLGVPFAAEELVLLKDPEARTLQIVTELSAVFPTVYIVGEIAVSVAQIVSQLAQGDELAALKERQVRSHLSTLEELGLLARKVSRGGWMPGPVLDLRT
jgi:Primase C terminal 1 (PriCT-1)